MKSIKSNLNENYPIIVEKWIDKYNNTNDANVKAIIKEAIYEMRYLMNLQLCDRILQFWEDYSN